MEQQAPYLWDGEVLWHIVDHRDETLEGIQWARDETR